MDLTSLVTIVQGLPEQASLAMKGLAYYMQNQAVITSIVGLLTAASAALLKEKAYQKFGKLAFLAARELAKLTPAADEDIRKKFQEDVYEAAPAWLKVIIRKEVALEIIENTYQTLMTVPVVLEAEIVAQAQMQAQALLEKPKEE